MAEMKQTRHGLGVGIWVEQAYPCLVTPINLLCQHMQWPGPDTRKHLDYAIMHVVSHLNESKMKFVGHSIGLEQPETLLDVTDPGAKAMYFQYFTDAALKIKSITGGVGLLACGPIDLHCARQHCTAPCAHSAEQVAGSSNLQRIIPINGVLQDVRIRLGKSTPLYMDSKTNVSVAESDAAIKRSGWTRRRALILQEGVSQQEIKPLHVPEWANVADAFTKYLKYAVWARHMSYLAGKKLMLLKND